jgi:hypothetical protein
MLKQGIALSICAALFGIGVSQAEVLGFNAAVFTVNGGQAANLGGILSTNNNSLASAVSYPGEKSFVQSTNSTPRFVRVSAGGATQPSGSQTNNASGNQTPQVSEDGLPVRVPIPTIIPKCEKVVPPVAMVAVINQETHGYPYEIYNNTLGQSFTYKSYQAAVAAGDAFRQQNDSVDEGITQVNSIYHPRYSSAYLFHSCGGIHAGANVLDETWKQYVNATPNPLMNAYLAIYHYNGNVQSSKCYGEEALQSIGINLGIHECSGATSQNGATPEILKISGSPEYRAESTPVSDSGVLSTGGLNELSTGDLNGLQAANQQMLQNPEAPAPTPATTRPPAPEQNSSKHIGEKDLLLLFVLALILAVFTFLTGGIGWLASWGMGTAASSAVSTIGSAAAGAAKKAAQIARGMGGGG